MFKIKILVVLILYLFTQFIGNSNVKCEDDLSSFTEGAYVIPNTENNNFTTWVESVPYSYMVSYGIDLDMEKPSQWRWHFKNEKGKEELKKLIDLLENIYESPQPINQ